jgi:AhpD family alkylhydroperoxidase
MPTVIGKAVSRLKPLEIDQAKGRSRAVLLEVQDRLDMVPNFMKMMAISPAAAEGYNGLNLAVRSGILPARIRESIALLVAQYNRSDYSLAAHSALAKIEGLSDEEIRDCRRGVSTDSLIQTALHFSHAYLEQKGHVSGKQLDAMRRAGYEDEEMVEIMATIALNQFTNYFNNAVKPEIDFPPVGELED